MRTAGTGHASLWTLLTSLADNAGGRPSGESGWRIVKLGVGVVNVPKVHVLDEFFGFLGGHVRSRVDSLVFEHLDQLVETDCNKGAESGSDPVNPVVSIELVGDDCGAE